MELSHMSSGIIKSINSKYDAFVHDECLDIIQIKNICSIYKSKKQSSSNPHYTSSISLSDMIFSSPNFKKISKNKTKSHAKNHEDILKSQEFIKKYSFFIRILYACLKIDVELFDIVNGSATLKNNYNVIKSLESKKKQLITDHSNILKSHIKDISVKISQEYETYVSVYLTKIKIIDQLISSINKLIKGAVVEKTDNLLSLILPYFYTYTDYIEEYN